MVVHLNAVLLEENVDAVLSMLEAAEYKPECEALSHLGVYSSTIIQHRHTSSFKCTSAPKTVLDHGLCPLISNIEQLYF